MTMQRVRVTGEYYRVGERGEVRYATPHDAAVAALQMLAGTDEGRSLTGIHIYRVTCHEPVERDILTGTVTETITGEAYLQGVMSVVRAAGLTRYHPNNGWCVPETIEIDVAGEPAPLYNPMRRFVDE